MHYEALVHHYDAISAQTDDSFVRLHDFIKSYSTMFKHVSVDVAKIIARQEKAAHAESVRAAQDLHIFSICSTAQASMMKGLLSLKTLLDQIRGTIWTPLKAFYKESLKSKERMDKEYKTAGKKLADLVKSIEKQEQDGLKTLAELKKKRTDPKLVDATRKKFAAYEAAVKQAQALQQSLHGEIMPRNLHEFEQLEQHRLSQTTEALQAFTTLMAEHANSAHSAADSIKQAIVGLQADSELRILTSYWTKRPAIVLFEPIEYNLPCRDSDIVGGNFEAEVEKRAARQQAFKLESEKKAKQLQELKDAPPPPASPDPVRAVSHSPAPEPQSPKAQMPPGPPASVPSTPSVVPSTPKSSAPRLPTPIAPSTTLSSPSAVTVQPPPPPSIATPASPPKPPAEPGKELTQEQKMTRARDQVAQEIVDTEVSYLKSLETAITVFLKPLEKVSGDPEASVLSKDQIATLFSNLETLYQLNSRFRDHLQKRRAEEWEANPQMGDLFFDFAPYFKMYTLYINNHEAATKLLASLTKDAKFSAFLAETHSSVPLASLLIEPVQRVPRYKLLLEVLIKNTPPDQPGFENLTKAFDAVSSVAKHINEQLRRRENQDKIAEIQSRFVGGAPNLMSPSRVLIRQGMLIKQCRNKDVPYEFFLFNDMVAYASKIPMSGMYKLHRTIDINSAFHVADDMAKTKNGFMIVSSTKSFKLIGASEEDKAHWLKDITNCMVAASRQVGAAEDMAHTTTQPVWQQDSTAKDCPYCKNKFSVMRRRHHCRKCGNLVCNDCSKRSFSLTPGEVKKRVCDDCANVLFKKRPLTTEPEPDASQKAVVVEAPVADAADVSSTDDEFVEPKTTVHEEESEDEEGLTEDDKGPLPPNWLLYFTDGEKLRYYFNTATEVTVWDRPTA